MRIFLIPLLALASIAASASDSAGDGPSIADILANQEAIRAEADAREGVFEEMPARKRKDLVAKSTSVSNALAGRQWADLSESERIEVFNSLEWIKATITSAEDERLVCEQKKRPGSNMIYKSCKTVAEQRRQREDAIEGLESLTRCMGACYKGN